MNNIKKEDLLNKIDFVTYARDIGIDLEQYNDSVEYRAFCPFKEHRKQAFFINKEKQVFYCFGCKKGGGIFTFVMMYKRCDFLQALRFLNQYIEWKRSGKLKKVA